jgi:hypothetical protein
VQKSPRDIGKGRRSNVSESGVPEREEREHSVPKLVTDIKPQIPDTPQAPSKINAKQITAQHVTVQLLKQRDTKS